MATKTTLIQLRVSPDEKTLWQHVSKAQGFSLSTWMRVALAGRAFAHIADEKEAEAKAKRRKKAR